MKKKEVENCYCSNNKWEEEVEGKESSKGSIVYGEPTSNSFNKYGSYVGDSGEEVGNDSGPSEGHLSSWKDISYEGSHYYEEKKHNSDVSCFFKEVGAVV